VVLLEGTSYGIMEAERLAAEGKVVLPTFGRLFKDMGGLQQKKGPRAAGPLGGF